MRHSGFADKCHKSHTCGVLDQLRAVRDRVVEMLGDLLEGNCPVIIVDITQNEEARIVQLRFLGGIDHFNPV